ncbi:MAG: beta-ketoacyl synthase N-terminal-like domain-containing protein [Thermodesulfobacteriota bacterium]
MNRQVAISACSTLPQDYTVPDELVRDLRRADDFIQMAVISAFAATAQAPARDISPEEIGVFIGTAFGPLETNFESLGSLIDDGEGQISPTLFSHSVYNSAAGYVARLLDIRGPALTITNYGWPFLIALEEARTAVASGRISRAVVIGVETYSELLADAYRRSYNVEAVPWERNAVAWVLDPLSETGGALCRLEGVLLSEADADSADFLTRRDESFSDSAGCGAIACHPMAYADALTEMVSGMAGLPAGEKKWTIEATFGRAEISLLK